MRFIQIDFKEKVDFSCNTYTKLCSSSFFAALQDEHRNENNYDLSLSNEIVSDQ